MSWNVVFFPWCLSLLDNAGVSISQTFQEEGSLRKGVQSEGMTTVTLVLSVPWLRKRILASFHWRSVAFLCIASDVCHEGYTHMKSKLHMGTACISWAELCTTVSSPLLSALCQNSLCQLHRKRLITWPLAIHFAPVSSYRNFVFFLLKIVG